MWAVSAVLVASLKGIPTYEILTIVFFIGFVCSVLYNIKNNNWKNITKHPFYIWVVGIIGIFGNELLFIMSFKYAPVAHADLINFLWPIMVILFSALLPNEKFHFRYLIASIIAFIAIYILIFYDNTGVISFEYQYIKGYVFAFSAALFWTCYTLISKSYGKLKPEMIGIYCGFGLVLSFCMHLYCEETVIPSFSNILALVFIGIATHCLAYFFWDYGIKKGNLKLLSILSYFNPIISILILILLGFAKPSIALCLATVLIFIAGVIGGIPWGNINSDG